MDSKATLEVDPLSKVVTGWEKSVGDCEGPVYSFHTRSFNVKEMVHTLIHAALSESYGNKSEAARKLGIDVRTLRRKLKRK